MRYATSKKYLVSRKTRSLTISMKVKNLMVLLSIYVDLNYALQVLVKRFYIKQTRKTAPPKQ
jgi:hypothetical protein